ncbi:AAA family ATPase [Trinickia fusca]|uniref:AAA family ATPase n=1 Tax=Trinickia fusca TaxID=2419777 RepID=UPI001C7D82D0|nr:AAA family ATPase [Trinickia fusca]
MLDSRLLKGLRKNLGISQETLAERCFNKQLCVSIASIKRAETGKPVLYRTARHLADIFEVDVRALVGKAGTAMFVEHEPANPPSDLPSAHAAKPLTANDYTQDDLLRYALELRFEWHPQAAASPAARNELAQLIGQFGGVLDTGLASQSSYAVAYFGMPRAYRSDAERCLLCALAISMESAAFIHPGRAIRVRLQRWPSESPKLACAGPGPQDRASSTYGHASIYVAGGLIAQLADRFDFAPADTESAPYRKCLRVRTPNSGSERSLTGRTVEIRQFKGIVDATRECQNGHVVYVRGMAGVGKSRLVAEFADIARQAQFACHYAEVLDFGMESAFAPLGQLARSLLGLPRQPLRGTREVALERWRLPAESNLFLQVLAGVSPDQAQMAVYAAMNNEARTTGMLRAVQLLLVRQALQQPLLVCIEDLHWGDPPLFTALCSLMMGTDEAPIVWVLTSRNEDDPLETALRPHFSNPLSLLDVAPMRAREAAALAEQYPEVDLAYRAHCVERAQGNPLYLTQLLSSPDVAVPESLKHLVQARLDKLGPSHRHALSVAAVIGNRFALNLLTRAVGQLDAVSMRADYQHIVREIEPGLYEFVHDLVMHCIYDVIPLPLRNHLHRIVANLVRESDPALYARHLVRAHDPAAFDALLDVMQAKLCAYQYEDVLELAQLCESFPEQAEANFVLALLRAQAAAGLGQTASARECFERAVALALRPADHIEAALGLAAVLNTLDSLTEEEQLLEATLPLARNLQADHALARLFHLRGNLYFPRGDYLRCRGYHEEALHFARMSGQLEIEACALSGIADSYYAEGRMQTAHDVFDQCVRICEKKGLPGVEAANRSARGSTLIYLGQPTQALQDALDSVQRSRAVCNRRAEIFSRLTAAWVLLATAEDRRAAQELDTALELARSMGASRFEAILLEGKARLASREGDQTAAQSMILEAADLVERLQLQSYVGPWIWGTLALITDDAPSRERALRLGEAQLASGCLAHNALRFHVAAAEASLVMGDYGRANRYAQQLSAFVQVEPCSWAKHHAQFILLSRDWLQTRDASMGNALQIMKREAEQLGFSATMPKLMEVLASVQP